MSVFETILLFGGGVFAGFVNTLAGGGSFVTLSLMMLMGLDANVANGTNRVAIIFQSLVSSETFRAHQMLDLKKGKIPLIATTLGSLMGAWVAVDLDKGVLEKVLALVMLAMLLFIFYKPSLWLKGNPVRYNKPSGIPEVALFLAIGFYGGLIQAGIGYLLLAGMVLQMGFDLVKANALKVLITLVYSPVAFLVFIWHGQVSWMHALPLAAGAVAGAFFASRMAIRRGGGFIRWVLAFMIIITSLKSFGLVDFSSLLSQVWGK
ncbi:MAG: sulfite exporter TauE/SafE family protein [Bacteroidales bacterium]